MTCMSVGNLAAACWLRGRGSILASASSESTRGKLKLTRGAFTCLFVSLVFQCSKGKRVWCSRAVVALETFLINKMEFLNVPKDGGYPTSACLAIYSPVLAWARGN